MSGVKTRVAAAILASAMTACSTPPNQMRYESPFLTFETDLAPAVAFRRVTEGARACYPMQHIEADFFPDNNTAQVSMSTKLELIIAALFVVNISPGANATNVRVAFLKRNPEFAWAAQQWMQGNYKNCP